MNKKISSVLLILLLCLTTYSQLSFISVSNPSIIPSSPITNSNIKVATHVFLPAMIGTLTSTSFNVNYSNNLIILKNSYCDGSLFTPFNYRDTTSIGILPAGTWTLNFMAYYSSLPLSNCNYLDSVLKSITFTVSTSSSLKEVADNLINVNVYPNPSKGIFNINSTFTKNQNLIIIVTDLLGRELLVKNLNALQGKNNFKLDLSTFQEGVYFVNFQEDVTNFKTLKIIRD
ncbi:MAG: T9SS type A sorting domain-containing protein [Bacteroidetes bacterium]|nr:T9SS type A sorting domain-containing protein [Bacteroidota bacterium]MCA6444194.1 T9SS type A sorting domain-containing protein [Bacteroidota bacterium]